MSAEDCSSDTQSVQPVFVVPVEEVRRFLVDCFMKVGALQPQAEVVAEVLVAADYRGHFSHGMNRIHYYLNDIKLGVTSLNSAPAVVKESPATAYVDGNNSLGAVVGKFCMQLAIEKAKKVGVGWIVCKGSNHYGIAGFYSMLALEHGLVGMSFTNTTPCVVPTRATEAVFGTNPISVAAPAKDGDSFVLDMATSVVSTGKIEVCKKQEKPIPGEWAMDRSGNVTYDASEAEEASLLLPLGGAEVNSGYKGYGLGMMVEVLCGVLAGSAFGPYVRDWRSSHTCGNLGQCFVALDPDCFASGFDGRLSDLMDYCRKKKPADSRHPVLVPGDVERLHMEKVDNQGGIEYHDSQIKECETLAKELGVKPMKTKQVRNI